MLPFAPSLWCNLHYALPLLRPLGPIPGAVGRSEPTTGAAMIAYLFWHCAYPTTTVEKYEEALMRFQQRLGQQQPPGFAGSASFRVAALPWLGNRPGYEDWCLLDGSWALDPLNAFAVAGPVVSAHDAAAAQMEDGYGGLYTPWSGANPFCRSGRLQFG